MIKPAPLARLTVLALLIGVASPAQAISLALTPGTQSVEGNGTVVVDLGISGLGDGVPPSLGGFNIDIAFDPEIVFLMGAELIAPLGGSAQFAFSVVGGASVAHVNLVALTSLTPAELDELQADAFTLARMTFSALEQAGTSPLVLGNVSLTNASGGALPLDSTSDAEIVVTPEPAASIAVGLGLVALAFRRLAGVTHP